MKFRPIVIILSITIGMLSSACSLAEDITPPPGYQYQPHIGTAVQTPDPAAPIATVAPEPGILPAATVLATSSQGTQTLGPQITFNGKVNNISGAPLSSPMTAHLYLYNSHAGTVDKTLDAQVNPSGDYQFGNVPGDTNTTYIVMVEFKGVTYSSDPATYDGSTTPQDLPVTIYDTTTELSNLSLMQVHIQFDFSIQGRVQAQILYVIVNSGQKTVIVPSDGTNIPFIKIPDGATDVQYELAQGGAPLTIAQNGFGLLPGGDKQYGIIATFSFPYGRSLTISQPFNLPVSSETVIVPTGVRVSSNQLVDAGQQTLQSQAYHLYQGNGLASGSTLTLTLSGGPGGIGSLSSNSRTIILLAIGLAGIFLIGLGVFLVIRDRRRLKQEPATAEVEMRGGATGDDRDSVLDAIVALDDQYKGNRISKDAYAKRRNELKTRLRQLL